MPARLAAAAAASPGRWRVSAIDPDGIDLGTAVDLTRLWLTAPATTRQQFDAALADVFALRPVS